MSVHDAFRAQSKACAALGSPFMGQLMALCADRLSPGSAVADLVLGWPGDPRPSADSVPLRLAGALHALVVDGTALADVYPPNVTADDPLWDAVASAFETHEDRLLKAMSSPPQTNEIRRSGVLIAALAEVAARYPDTPVELLELGASAGLNLTFDHYRLTLPGGTIGPDAATVHLIPDWTGPAPPNALPKVIARSGVDLNPLDPTDPADRLRLMSYLWPDQPHRLQLTEAAMAVAAQMRPEVATGDAGAWLSDQLTAPSPDRLRVVFHTVAWQYFPAETARVATDALAAAASPTVQIGMESDLSPPGASVTLTHWPEGRTEHLGRADFHGRWITWH